MSKLKYESDKQVMEHIRKSKPEKSESMAHERRESPKFEKAEHRLYSKAKGKSFKGK